MSPSMKLTMRCLTIVSLASLVSAGVARANNVYPINTTITSSDPTGNPAQSDTVSGSITTDGTIGILLPANIVNWNLNLIDNLNSSDDYDLTPSNSSLVEDTGSALSASATALLFNFGATGEFLIQANSPGPFSGSHYFCFSTGGACLEGETISPQVYNVDGVVLTGASAPVGVLPLAPNSTPEPSSSELMLMGILCLGGVLGTWWKKIPSRPADWIFNAR